MRMGKFAKEKLVLAQLYKCIQNSGAEIQISKNNSQSMDKNQYHYDFSYSIALENPGLEGASDDLIERSFMDWCEIFITRKIFKIDDGHKFTTLLLRVPAFRKLGLQLLKLCLLTYGEGVEDKNSAMEKCREYIYAHLQELEKILGGQKQKYLNIVIISMYAIIQRTAEKEAKIIIEDEFAIFHLIYWELKGQLINKQNMENLIDKFFLVEEFHRFMFWDKEELIYHPLRNTGPIKRGHESPLTFRSRNGEQNLIKPNSQMYQSFKQLSLKSEIRMERKQNVGFNNREHSQLEHSKIGVNLGLFRKKSQYETVCQEEKTMLKPAFNQNKNSKGRPYEGRQENKKVLQTNCAVMNARENLLSFRQPKEKQFQFQFQNR